MKLPHSARAPDLLFLAKEHLGRLRESRIEGPADLVVEMVSKESRGRDGGETFYEYGEGGVPAYRLLDPQLEEAEFYQLDAQGRYQVVASDDNGMYHAKVAAGFWLRVAWLWRQPRLSSTQRRWQAAVNGHLQGLRLLDHPTALGVHELVEAGPLS